MRYMTLSFLKKTFSAVILAALVGGSVFAQSSSSTDWLTVATVSYNGVTAISGRDLREAINRAVRGQLASQPVSNTSALESAISNGVKQLQQPDKRQVLDTLINQKLLIQAANKAKIVITDTEVNNQLNQYRQQMASELQNNSIASDDTAFASAIYTYMGYSSISDFKNNYIQPGLLVQKYIQQMKGSELKPDPPTDAQVNQYFRLYQSQFVQPEILTVYYIAEQYTDDAGKAAAKKDLAGIASAVGSSSSKFNDRYMGLTGAQSGVQAGQWTLPLSTEYAAQFVQQFGEPVLDEIMALKVNQVSSVIEGPHAYFILKLQKDESAKLLGLRDNYPGSNQTMDTYIRTMVNNQNAALALQKAQNEIINDLKKSGNVVSINDANLAKVLGS
jgi:parvulin-like peptidyl-prolyl isomerase